jgi:ribose-phosphate pyrophosphokinase
MNPVYGKLKVFSGRANMPLAEKVAEEIGDPLGKLSIGAFPDGETTVRIEEDVRGRDVFIIQPTCPPVNENLMQLLIILDAVMRASAARITAVLPYFGYARQDRKDTGRVPITAKLVANLLSTTGIDRVIALDLHAAQIQGFFDIPVDHLHAFPVFNSFVKNLNIPSDKFVVLSPDEGNVKRVLRHQSRLGGSIAIVDKRRMSGSEIKTVNLIGGPLDGKTCIIFDDMISTGSSVVGAAKIAMEFGAKAVYACATHGVFCGPAVTNLRESPLTEVVVTDTIPLPNWDGETEKTLFDPPDKKPAAVKSPVKHPMPNLRVVSVAPLIADAIKRIHGNQSVSVLFE